ncbi:MAG: indole-3-glycerol phosphate synthase TrpC [candidate division Zixibacteria bacterium]|nr:indole-3-glycerol phosphate synthase TrpC [candidate division Zixibacteria bacterium]
MLREIIRYKRSLYKNSDFEKEMDSFLSKSCAEKRSCRLKTALSSSDSISLIAEIKRHSPSKGTLAKDISAPDYGRCYEQAGASAVSILTDEVYFHGSPDDIIETWKKINLPILRKEFIVCEQQILESKTIGADAILLIAAVLAPDELIKYHTLAESIGLEVLTEVHNEDDLSIALGSGANIIGVNNRNLEDFSVSLKTSERIIPLIPEGIIRVSESGIRNREDMLLLESMEFDAALVGESIVTSPSPESHIRTLLGLK